MATSRGKANTLSQWARTKKKGTFGSLLSAIIVQVVLLSLTIFVVVLVPQEKEEPAFVAHKTIYLPQEEMQHKLDQAAFEQIASSPMVMERLKSESLAEHSLPSLPELPQASFASSESLDAVPPSSCLMNPSRLASITGTVSSNSSVSFFGVQGSGQRIVIAFDVSKSVLNKAEQSGVSIQRIKRETTKLINDLGPNTMFGVVQFIRRYELFETQLLAGTKATKNRAIEWLDSGFHTTGNSPSNWQRLLDSNNQPRLDGIQAVMEVVFEMEPDLIFIISDGGFGRNFPKRTSRIDLNILSREIHSLQQALPKKAKIHFIGFEVKEEREKVIKRIVRKSGGSYRSF